MTILLGIWVAAAVSMFVPGAVYMYRACHELELPWWKTTLCALFWPAVMIYGAISAWAHGSYHEH